jgi:AP-3 complex subunit delta-1
MAQSSIFSKSLQTMIKGIRAHKEDEAEYVAKCIAETKVELRDAHPDTKVTAVRKCIYLQLLGHDVAFASFSVVEVMSMPWFGDKRVGYLAAALTFNKQTDVVLLTTHLFRKGFTGASNVVVTVVCQQLSLPALSFYPCSTIQSSNRPHSPPPQQLTIPFCISINSLTAQALSRRRRR